jgi:hypothetical protein
MADEFQIQPTPREIQLLKAKRAADEASRIDIDTIKPGMTQEAKQKVLNKIRELWSH